MRPFLWLLFAGSFLIAKTAIAQSAGEGRRLAEKYCGSCHQFPEPALLDKTTWENGVLPNMAARLGIKMNSYDPYEGVSDDEIAAIRRLLIYPEKPQIRPREWQQIKDFYLREAPDTLAMPPHLTPEVANFTPYLIRLQATPLPQVVMVKAIDNSQFVDLATGEHFTFDKGLQLQRQRNYKLPVVDGTTLADGSLAWLNIGSFTPTETAAGSLFTKNRLLLSSLHRPTDVQSGDLNNDGVPELVLCQFGNHTGRLSWFEQLEAEPKEHVLSLESGYRQTYLKDWNNDGKTDIIALQTQARETVWCWRNTGDGKFEPTTLVTFPPVYGLSYLELHDFNNDGKTDLLLTNGDNWDYSPIPKPYHGVRVLLNQGESGFCEAFFYPLVGAVKAIARDFDADGDLDIAAISFYNQSNRPEDNFIYLQSNGELQFKPMQIPQAQHGKWLCLAADDVDNDGDPDLLLGSYFQSILELPYKTPPDDGDFPDILFLRNPQK